MVRKGRKSVQELPPRSPPAVDGASGQLSGAKVGTGDVAQLSGAKVEAENAARLNKNSNEVCRADDNAATSAAMSEEQIRLGDRGSSNLGRKCEPEGALAWKIWKITQLP